MYLRTTPRRNTDGSVVRYLQLAHNTWDPQAKRSRVQVLYNFGREDANNRAALQRLVASVSRFLDPDQALAATASEGLAFVESRPLGGAWTLDGLWRRLGIDQTMRRLLKGRRLDPTAERVLFALVANRALAPSSKLAAAGWVNDDVAIEGLERTSDDACYRAMDWLLEIHRELEREVFGQVATLLDLEVQQRGDLAEHLAFQLTVDLQQPVHRPVAGVVAGALQPLDGHVVVDPAGGGQLRGGRQRAVGDQREQHPLGGRVQPPALEQPPHRLVDAKAAPQAVQRPGPAQWSRLDERQPLAGGGGQRLVGVQEPGDRGDQALQRGAVVGVLAAEVVEHLHPGPFGGRVPGVVGQLQVAHYRAVGVAPWGRPQVHGLDISISSEADQLVLG